MNRTLPTSLLKFLVLGALGSMANPASAAWICVGWSYIGGSGGGCYQVAGSCSDNQSTLDYWNAPSQDFGGSCAAGCADVIPWQDSPELAEMMRSEGFLSLDDSTDAASELKALRVVADEAREASAKR